METKKDNLSKIIRNIQNVGGHLAGVVINKMPISIKKYNENYYYASTSGDTMKSSRNEIKEKAYNVLKQNDTENYNRQKKDRASSVEERNKANIEDVMEKPKFVKNGPTDSIDRSIDILQQINSYLDNEKKNLN